MIFVFGLDGLEYDFVEKWNLTNLKQKDYGKFQVPIDKKRKVPYTPQVWYTFLTGVNVKEMDFDKGFLFKLLNSIKRVGKSLNLNLSFGLGYRILSDYDFPKLKHKTFLDDANSVKINAPYYNYNNEETRILRLWGYSEITLKRAKELLDDIYEKKKIEIIRRTKNSDNVDIVFAYLRYPDIIQHICYPTPSEIKKYYIDLDSSVLKIKSLLNDTTLFLIISDHGFSTEEKCHSDYGFYSSSIVLRPKPTKMTDFFRILNVMLNKH